MISEYIKFSISVLITSIFSYSTTFCCDCFRSQDEGKEKTESLITSSHSALRDDVTTYSPPVLQSPRFNVQDILKEKIIITPRIESFSERIISENKMIFLSYCWSMENETKPMVDDFENFLKELGINNYYRDLREDEGLGMTTGTNIEKFMENTKRSDAVVIFLNEAYLRSRNCMYEFLQVWDNINRKLSSKAFVIIHPECNLFGGPRAHVPYTNYWQDVLKNIKEDEKLLDITNKEWHVKEAIFSQEIYQNMPYIINYLGSHIQANYKLLRSSGFLDVLRVTVRNNHFDKNIVVYSTIDENNGQPTHFIQVSNPQNVVPLRVKGGQDEIQTHRCDC